LYYKNKLLNTRSQWVLQTDPPGHHDYPYSKRSYIDLFFLVHELKAKEKDGKQKRL